MDSRSITRRFRAFVRPLLAILCFVPLLAAGQTLNITNDVQSVATLTNTTATLTGKAELHVTGTGDPIPGCVIHLNSPDAWLFMDNIAPSVVASTFVSRMRVSGANAVLDTNVRVVQFAMGTVVIPHAPDFSPMTVFDGKMFAGPSKLLRTYVKYNDTSLGALKTAISSFRLKRGYMATVAQQENGTGISKCYVAQDGDIEVGALPGNLDNQIRFVRVFPWRWVSKKGIAGNIEGPLNVRWVYDWGASRQSPLDWEYVPIKQTQYWPPIADLDPAARRTTHLLGFNEPDRPDQANLTVAQAIAGWPELLGTGLRVGAPAVADPNTTWIDTFIAQADAAGLRVDFVPVHYYRSHPNGNDPWGAAWNMEQALRSLYARVKRPLWVTEWNNGANWTGDPDPTYAQQRDAVDAMTWTLDNLPFVERYSIYNWVEDVRRVAWDNGSLTDAGIVYRDRQSPNAVLQELPDAGTSAAAHYSFNGDTRDSSGNGHDGTPVGAPVFVTGKYGQAISLDGATDYVQLSPRLGDSTDFSFTGWVWWNGGGNWQRIFDLGDGTDRYLCLTPKSGSNTLRFIIKNVTEQTLETTVLPTGQWVHVGVTIAGNTGKLFVNGALVNTNASMTFNPVDLGTKTNYLGKSQWPDPLFNGRLDDLRFFTTALTDAQVAAIAANAPPQFNGNPIAANATKLVPFTSSIAGNATGGNGAVTFSKLSGPAWLAVAANGSLTGVPGLTDGGVNAFAIRAMDAAGALGTTMLQVTVADAPGLVTRYAFENTANATAGTANGVTTGSPAYAAGRYESAIDLDGVDDFVSLPKGAVSYPEITIAAWLYWDGGGNWQRVFDFGNGTGEYLFLSPKTGANTMRFEIKNNGGTQLLETAPLAIGQWVHVAVTLGANTGRLYVNGAQVASGAITIRPSDFDPVANFLGKSQFADPLFDGRIDEFMIFNQALSGAQVAAIAGGRAPVFTADPVTKPAATAAQPYEQTLAGAATDPDAGSVLTYSKVSGPAWLTVAANGRIAGVPTSADAGANRFIVRATDQTLLATDAALTIIVPGAGGIIANYQFDGNTTEAAGGTAGVATGSPVYSAGVFDKAIRLDGSDDFVRLPAGIVNGLTDITLAARVRWDGGGSWQRIFDFGNNTTQYMVLTPKSSPGTLRFTISATGQAGEQILETSQMVIGEWTHLAVTLIGNTGTLYVNGAPATSGTITLDPANLAPVNNYLGKAQFTADPLFAGLIDDFRIYNRGLSAAEVSALAVPLAAVAVPDSSYAGWAAAYTFPGGLSGGLDDADNDGLTNAWEYLTGTSPVIASSGALPQPHMMTAAALGLGNTGKTYLTIQARVRKVHLGATVVPEAAATLPGLALPSASTQALQAGPPVADGEFEVFTYYFGTPLEDSPTGTGFIRVRAAID